MYIVTTQQMQAAEKAANDSGLSYDQMMEHAGHAVAKAIDAYFDITGVRVLVLVGPGNNGGDGLVVARYLAQLGAIVTVYVWKRKTKGDNNWALLDAANVEKVLSSDSDSRERLNHLLDEAGIIVDALLGTGVSRPIEGTLAELLNHTKTTVEFRLAGKERILVEPALPALDNEFGPAVVAVDVPSGLNSDTGAVDPHTLAADITVTLAAVKQGHILGSGPEVVGQLVVGDIGLTEEYYPDNVNLKMVTAAHVALLLPRRPVAAHKGTFGTALLIAGSIYYTGAAVLAGRSATRVGTGLVTLALPQTVHPIVASQLTEATYLPLPDQEGAVAPEAVQLVQKQLGDVDALLVGPGLSQLGQVDTFLHQLLAIKEALPPLILDADALNILARQANWWQLPPPHCILTPHPGEMARLMGITTADVQTDRLKNASEMAAKWNHIVLLKGAHTVIAAPDGRMVVMPFANPALAKAGSGDVLAGAIAGLRAQGLAPFEAAVAGAYLQGLAGEIARDSIGAMAAVAGDLVDFLATATLEIRGK